MKRVPTPIDERYEAPESLFDHQWSKLANEDSFDSYKAWEQSSQWPSSREWLTCPASPGRQLCYLVPPFFFKVVAFHTSDGLRCLAPNYHHQLERQKCKHLNEQPLHIQGFKMSNKDTDVESVRMKMGGRAGRKPPPNQHVININNGGTG